MVSSNEDIVREYVTMYGPYPVGEHQRIVNEALDALVAERDAAQERGNTWREHFENTNTQLNRKQVECDDLIVRVLAAEAA